MCLYIGYLTLHNSFLSTFSVTLSQDYFSPPSTFHTLTPYSPSRFTTPPYWTHFLLLHLTKSVSLCVYSFRDSFFYRTTRTSCLLPLTPAQYHSLPPSSIKSLLLFFDFTVPWISAQLLRHDTLKKPRCFYNTCYISYLTFVFRHDRFR